MHDAGIVSNLHIFLSPSGPTVFHHCLGLHTFFTVGEKEISAKNVLIKSQKCMDALCLNVYLIGEYIIARSHFKCYVRFL